MLGVPEWSLSLLVVLGVMGFPLVLLLAWTFQVTPDGIIVDRSDSSSVSEPGRQLDMIVNVLLLLSAVALAGLLVLQFFSTRPGSAQEEIS